MAHIEYQNIATQIRKKILNMKLMSQSSHIGSDFSCVDILTVLYFKILKLNIKNSKEENRDRFILSKGHAASALYATLARRGFFSEDILKTYCQNGSALAGHTIKDCVPGVEVSTGSLGHGLPIGIGMALSAKKDKKNRRIFVLISDGECDEGSNWEAALFAGHHKLENLVAIIDYNKIQSFGMTNKVLNLEPLKQKWESFGWQVKEADGHNFKELEKTLLGLPFKKNYPSIIIAHTKKGAGVSFMENELSWHYKSPTQEQYDIAIKELDNYAKRIY
ncbi:MAG: transketolase [Candidatus Staskawiczbacteria bacterium]|nr:transketolase [Candidatus Staskawiczbacteria bacterium]MBI3337222.1 transketolase [Candidatus Staskawiczbacteria bacterium]